WLDPGLADLGELHGLFAPTDEVALRIEPVSDLVNNVRNDGPNLVVPIDPTAVTGGESSAAPALPGLFD
ncbi:MAG TPA: hypothetical protein VH440_04425, partial [Candidatus Limnocylindrales bacterium]